jgi:hypothetical protein
MATIPNEFRESQASAPGFQFRASIGRFHNQKASGQPLLLRGVVEGRSRDSFFETCFCLGWIPALSVENGRIIGLSRLFRSMCFPLGISVEDHVLEIAGLESRSGLIMGEFRWKGLSSGFVG